MLTKVLNAGQLASQPSTPIVIQSRFPQGRSGWAWVVNLSPYAFELQDDGGQVRAVVPAFREKVARLKVRTDWVQLVATAEQSAPIGQFTIGQVTNPGAFYDSATVAGVTGFALVLDGGASWSTSGQVTAQLVASSTPKSSFTGSSSNYPQGDANVVGSKVDIGASGTSLPNTTYFLGPGDFPDLTAGYPYYGVEIEFPSAPTTFLDVLGFGAQSSYPSSAWALYAGVEDCMPIMAGNLVS